MQGLYRAAHSSRVLTEGERPRIRSRVWCTVPSMICFAMCGGAAESSPHDCSADRADRGGTRADAGSIQGVRCITRAKSDWIYVLASGDQKTSDPQYAHGRFHEPVPARTIRHRLGPVQGRRSLLPSGRGAGETGTSRSRSSGARPVFFGSMSVFRHAQTATGENREATVYVSRKTGDISRIIFVGFDVPEHVQSLHCWTERH
jgi:hypothetical protein